MDFGLGLPVIYMAINPILRMEMIVKNYADILKKLK